MALYVAVYDVHPGDRKHFERLLQRVSDNRQNPADIIYIESFGSIEALLKTPQKFDTLILDAGSIEENLELSSSLREKKITAPLALYLAENKKADTHSLMVAKTLENITFYTKSIKNPDIENIVNTARLFSERKAPRIELRDAKETHFVLPDDILYATLEDSFMNVALTDGRSARILKDLNDFIKDLSGYFQYIQVGKNRIINLNHVIKMQSRKFYLDDNTTISYSIFESKRMSELFEKYQKIKSGR